MSMSWESAEKKASKGPIGLIGVVLLVGSIGVAGIWAVGTVFGVFGEAAQVAKEEFGPRAMLKKYEWFKDAAAQLDKKKADIDVYKARIDSLKADYEGVKRKDWARSDTEQMHIWNAEFAGVKASYNSLAAQYNSQMSKFNWSFTNAGDLPKGATEVLPREYRAYEGK